MTTEEEVGPVEVEIATCSVCDALFLMSGRRETSPCHGSDPGVILAMLTIFPDGKVIGGWGVIPATPDSFVEEQPAPVVPEEPPAPEEEEKEQEESEEVTPWVRLRLAASGFLVLANASSRELRDAFLAAGAEPEIAATSVGRLEAVRDELRRLMVPEDRPPVAPAPSEAEDSPETSPPTPLTDAAAGV